MTPPPSPPGECVCTPRLGCGGDIFAGWRLGGGSIFWKTPGTALYSTYVSTLRLGCYRWRSPLLERPGGSGPACWTACPLRSQPSDRATLVALEVRWTLSPAQMLVKSTHGIKTPNPNVVFLVFNRVYRVEIQSVMLVFSTPLVN